MAGVSRRSVRVRLVHSTRTHPRHARTLTHRSGPNFIHTPHPSNPLTQLAHTTNTTLHTFPEMHSLYGPSGSPIPAHTASEVSDKFWGVMSDAFAASRASRDSSQSGGESVGAHAGLLDFVRKRAWEVYPDAPADDEAHGKRELLMREAEGWGGYVGGETAEQSLKWLWLEEAVEGDAVFVAGTYERIMRGIAEGARGADLRVGVVVVRVETGVGGCCGWGWECACEGAGWVCGGFRRRGCYGAAWVSQEGA